MNISHNSYEFCMLEHDFDFWDKFWWGIVLGGCWLWMCQKWTLMLDLITLVSLQSYTSIEISILILP